MAHPEIRVDRLLSDLHSLARGVRLAGSRDEAQAFDHIEAAARACGLPVERSCHPALISLPISARVHALERDLPAITHSFSPSADVSAQLAMPGEDPSGRIALVHGLASPEAIATLSGLGAAAVLFLNGARTHEMIVSSVWGSPEPGDLGRYPLIPAASLAGEAQAAILEAAGLGGTAIVTTEVETLWREIPILTADIPGQSEEFVLFSGHVDSWHRGAMDNAAANSAQLEIMRILAAGPHRRGLRLGFWSGHSQGRYAGSAHYADSHFQDLYTRCIAHVNIDSVGGRGATVLTDPIAMPETQGVAREVLQEFGVDFTGSFPGRAGDQSFYGIGVPSLFMTLSEQPRTEENRHLAELLGTPHGGLGTWWHTAEDLPDMVDPELLVRDTAVYLGVLRRFLDDARLPIDVARGIEDLAKVLSAHLPELDALGAQALPGQVRAVTELWRRVQEGRMENTARERLLIRATRLLVPLRQVAHSRYGQDPALGLVPYPGIPWDAADESGRIALRRGLNRVRHALLDLEDLARLGLAAHAPEGSDPNGIL